MAHRDYEGSEYGGKPGIIQPGVDRVEAAAAAAGYGHESTMERAVDRDGVRDAAMIMRRAGLKEANGIVAERVVDSEGVVTNVPYSEERAREDYLNGENY